MKKNNISPHITYAEATRSTTAERYNIDNTPTETQLEHGRYVALNVFEPLRSLLCDRVIHINSFFRSWALNRKVGGSTRSFHLNMQAIDLDNDTLASYKDVASNNEIFHMIRESLDFTELVAEYPDKDGKLSWVHVALQKGRDKEKKIWIMTHSIDRNGSSKKVKLPYRGHEHLVA